MKKKNFLLIIYLILFCKISFANEIYEIKAKKLLYKDNNKLIIAEGDAQAKDNFGKEIYSDKIIYDKKNNIIKTFGNSKFLNKKIIISADEFAYNIFSKILVANKNIQLVDGENNKFFFDTLKYNFLTQKGNAKNIKSLSNDNAYLESKNGEIDNKNKIFYLSNSIYTTCSNLNQNEKGICPSWSLKSKKIIHDKKKKIIKHYNPTLRILNIPVLYSPYLSHPDPEVKRKSGFLPPMIKTLSDVGRTVKIPYFYAISDNKDLTITPTYYLKEHSLFQTSYRQIFKHGFLQIENGFSKGYKNTQGRTKGSRNYTFLDYNTNLKNIFYQNNEINFKIQRISQENFARVNKINTDLFKENIRSLENILKLTSYESNKRLEFKTGIYENLDLNDSQKYTFYLPSGKFSYNSNYKNIKTNFNSYFETSKFLDNQKQSKIRNLITFKTQDKIFKKSGISSNFTFSLLNNNIYNDNVSNQKNNENIDNYLTFANDISIPFAKFKNKSYHLLKPRLFAKYTTGKMLDASSDEKSFNYSDIFSLNRTNNLDKPETGSSVGYGINYNYTLNSPNNQDSFKTNFGIGQILKSKKEENMPSNSSLNNKSSDFAGFLKFNYNGKVNKLYDNIKNLPINNIFRQNNLTLDYKFNLNNDFAKLNRNRLELNTTLNKFNSSLIFDEKNNHTGNERFATFSLKKLINEEYYFAFETKKDLKNDRSEYNKMSLNYENDCIIFTLSLAKDFYSDKDIQNSKSLIFGIILKPFSDSFGPDLTEFIN